MPCQSWLYLIWQTGMHAHSSEQLFNSQTVPIPAAWDPWSPAVRICTWNGHACFPADEGRFRFKRQAVKDLLKVHDFVMLQETHLSKRSIRSLRRLAEMEGFAVFAFLGSQSFGGVACLVRCSFMEENFAQVTWSNLRPELTPK